MKEMKTRKGDSILVDDEDYQRLSQYTWFLSSGGGYPVRNDSSSGHKRQIALHRELMQAENGQFIDHQNGNKLDNRKCNLRFADMRQNGQNRRLRNEGVFLKTDRFRSKPWQAQIKVNSKTVHLGSYASREDAQAAYKQASLRYHGAFSPYHRSKNMVNPNQYQQGDVVVERIPAIPADAKPVEGAVLAEGEGHHLHRFAVASDVELYVKDSVRFARVKRDSVIEHVTPDGRHGEHNPITIPAGDYQFGQVMEYDYLNEMAREVVD